MHIRGVADRGGCRPGGVVAGAAPPPTTVPPPTPAGTRWSFPSPRRTPGSSAQAAGSSGTGTVTVQTSSGMVHSMLGLGHYSGYRFVLLEVLVVF